MFGCTTRKLSHNLTVGQLRENYYGHGHKSIVQDMVCFQQASCNFLQLYKEKNMHMPWKSQQLKFEGDTQMVEHEIRLHKYLDRMYDIVQCRHKKYKQLSKDQIFKELDKVVNCQLTMTLSEEAHQLQQEIERSKSYTLEEDKHVLSGVPLLDIILNIDWFTAQFDDRIKVVQILKDLFANCKAFKKLLSDNSPLILSVLLHKYDKKCHLYINCAQKKEKGLKCNMNLENRDEFLAGIIGQLIRSFAKSMSLSKGFCNFEILNRLVTLMQNERFEISGDAQRTFEAVLKGNRLDQHPDRVDAFVQWIDQNKDGDNTHQQLNKIFFDMRQSSIYAFKRYSIKIQYDVLFTGLQQCIVDISSQHAEGIQKECHEQKYKQVNYYAFSKFFADNKYNLKDVMMQISTLNDESEQKIKEGFYLLLSLFVLTYEYRAHTIQMIIYKNRGNFKQLIDQFQESHEDEDIINLLSTLKQKLDSLEEIPQQQFASGENTAANSPIKPSQEIFPRQ